jgi:hypothetical protein
MKCIRCQQNDRYRTRLICLACIGEDNRTNKYSSEHYRRHAERINAERRVKYRQKTGRPVKISYEQAIDAFGRVKDGETRKAISKELGVSYQALHKAFIRVGPIDPPQRATA